jgi:hypothetical protein
MRMSEWFGWTASSVSPQELPAIFPMPISELDFVTIDVIAIFSKILTDVVERTNGLSDEQTALLWDNCLKSEKPDGLITMVSKAMADKKELFLVVDSGIVREADATEREKIRADYKKSAKSATGVFVSFSTWRRSDMIKFYLALSYCTASSLWKTMNLSKAVQLKFSDLRKSVSATDSEDVKAQGQLIATALGKGNPVMLDAKDMVETATPDLKATQEAVDFVDSKLAFYLGMPDSYLCGEQTAGLGSSGENDMRAVERGLKNYYVSIMKPILEALFSVKLQYKSQDFTLIAASVEVLKTFTLIDDTLVSADNKRRIVNGLLGLPEDAEGDPAPKVEPVALPAPKPKPGAEATA